jgi:FkbM family methyltransferase
MNGFVKFCRLKLGLKPVIDYAQYKSRLLGVRDLQVRTIFDIGANVGKKSKLYRRLFPQAKIHSFEPLPSCFEKLDRWASKQQGQVQTYNLALGSRPDTMTIHFDRSHPGGSTLLDLPSDHHDDYADVKVRVETLDSIADGLSIEDNIFVKIDVEGFDMDVMRGGMNLLQRASAVIVEAPLVDAPTERPMFADYVNLLGALGYSFRGNLACAYVEGIPRLADAVFIKGSVSQADVGSPVRQAA